MRRPEPGSSQWEWVCMGGDRPRKIEGQKDGIREIRHQGGDQVQAVSFPEM